LQQTLPFAVGYFGGPLRLPYSLLCQLSFGNVTGDLRRSDDFAAEIFNRGDGQGDVKLTSVFGKANAIEVIIAFAPPYASKYLLLLALQQLCSSGGISLMIEVPIISSAE
jgi:hypothetical protein